MKPAPQQPFRASLCRLDLRHTPDFGYPLVLAILVLAATTSTGATAATFPKERTYDDHQLVLQGEGRANYLLWDIYDAALYLPRGTKSDAILAPSTARCLVIHYLRDIKGSDLMESAQHMLRKQLTEPEWQALSPRIQALNDRYQDVRPGDQYRLCYSPKRGTSLYFNDRKVITVTGVRFATAYFGIWLNKQDPIAPALRRALINNP